MTRSSFPLLPAFGALVLAGCGPTTPTSLTAVEGEPASPDVSVAAAAADGASPSSRTFTESYRAVTASITVPGSVEELADLAVAVAGEVEGASPFDITAWSLWEKTDWSYDETHRTVVSGGTRLAGSTFHFGGSVAEETVVSRPASSYRFTFIFGPRSSQHGFYDVAVDAEVVVGPARPELCRVGWRPPHAAVARAGRTLPLKFVAYLCEDGSLFRDEGVEVRVAGPTDEEVSAWGWTGDPATGVAPAGHHLHVNWRTDRAARGPHVVTVRFSNGDTLERTVTLR